MNFRTCRHTNIRKILPKFPTTLTTSFAFLKLQQMKIICYTLNLRTIAALVQICTNGIRRRPDSSFRWHDATPAGDKPFAATHIPSSSYPNRMLSLRNKIIQPIMTILVIAYRPIAYPCWLVFSLLSVRGMVTAHYSPINGVQATKQRKT